MNSRWLAITSICDKVLGENLKRSFSQHSSAAYKTRAHTYSCWFPTRTVVCAGRELITLTHRALHFAVPRFSHRIAHLVTQLTGLSDETNREDG